MGRPSFKPTDKDRRRVSVAAGAGMSEDEIALALGIARGTLLKYFKLELTAGRAERRVEVALALFRQAKDGNVAACKAYLGGSPKAVTPAPTGAEFEGDAKGKRGKKAQADEDAKTAQAGTEWSDLLPSASRNLQ